MPSEDTKDTTAAEEEEPSSLRTPDQCCHCSKPAGEGIMLKICTQCCVDSYCSLQCQRAEWPNHSKRCVDKGVWKLLRAIESGDMDLVRKLSKSSKVANGESKVLGRGGGFGMVTIPVIACVRYDNVEALRVLLESGNVTKIDRRDGDGDTALHMAASKPNNVEIIQLLLQHGADPNVVASDGFSVLMMAARDHDLDNTRCILEAGVHRQCIHATIGRLEMMSGGKMLHPDEPFEAL